MEETSMTQRLEGPGREHGFSMIQVIVILALVSIVTAFGAIGVVNARAQMRLNSSVRQFASWAEKSAIELNSVSSVPQLTQRNLS